MIGLYTAGNAFDMGKDPKITVLEQSPLFRDEQGYGSQSYAFSLPLTKRNRKMLNYGDLASKKERTEYFDDIELRHGSLTLHIGRLRLESVSTSGFKCSFLLDDSSLGKKLGDTQLRNFIDAVDTVSLPSGGSTSAEVETDMLAHAKTVAQGDVDTYNYTFFPIRNRAYYDPLNRAGWPAPDELDGLHETQTYPVYYDDVSEEFAGSRFLVPGGGGTITTHTIIPFLYLRYVLGEILDELGFSFDYGTFFTDAEIKNLVVYNNKSLDTAQRDDVAANPDLDTWWLGNVITHAHHLPRETTAYDLFLNFRKLFNVYIHIDHNQSIEFIPKKDILSNTTFQDFTKKTLSYFTDNTAYINPTRYYSTQDPNDTFSSLLLEERPELEAGPYATFADLPSSATNGVFARTEVEEKIFQFNDENDTWEFISYDTYPAGTGEGINQNAISTLETSSTLVSYPMPETEQLGSSDRFWLGEHPYSLRLLFYAGMVQHGPGLPDIPTGRSTDHNNLYNYSLKWDGSNGLYEKWHKPWVDVITAAKPITAQACYEFLRCTLLQVAGKSTHTRHRS